MRSTNGKSPKDFFPMLFEDDDDRDIPEITDEEIAQLQAEMDSWIMADTNPQK